MSGEQEGGRLIVRGAQATALGFAARLAARLIFLFIAGRLFGASAFGAFALALAVVELAVAVGSLGTKKTLFHLLDRHGGESRRPLPHLLLDAALLVGAASLMLGIAIGAAALAMPASLLGPAVATALLWLAPTVAGQALLDLLLAATRWTHAIRHEVVARSVIEPWAMLAGTAGAWLLGWRAEGLAIGYGCGTLAALIYAASAARRRLGGLRLPAWRPNRRALAETVRGSADNTATDLLNVLYNRVDLYLVGALLGEAPAGIYGMARQLAAPLRQIRQSFDGLLIPLAARSLAAGGVRGAAEALASATRLVLVLQLPLLLAFFAAGRPFLAWIGADFAAAYWALVALAAAETLQAALSVGDLVFVYLRPRVGLWLTLGSIVVGIAAALCLIPALGTAGAALSVLLAYGVRAAIRSWVLRASFGFDVPRAHNAAPLAASACGAAAAWLIGGGWWALAASVALYAVVLASWLKATGERLALSGFAVPAEVRPS
ncbi:MAG TPA: oligosaccharide flippase family protein [Allosphingosinicella sp.]|jgi:O-antigen/teichoic acid export membrane protein